MLSSNGHELKAVTTAPDIKDPIPQPTDPNRRCLPYSCSRPLKIARVPLSVNMGAGAAISSPRITITSSVIKIVLLSFTRKSSFLLGFFRFLFFVNILDWLFPDSLGLSSCLGFSFSVLSPRVNSPTTTLFPCSTSFKKPFTLSWPNIFANFPGSFVITLPAVSFAPPCETFIFASLVKSFCKPLGGSRWRVECSIAAPWKTIPVPGAIFVPFVSG